MNGSDHFSSEMVNFTYHSVQNLEVDSWVTRKRGHVKNLPPASPHQNTGFLWVKLRIGKAR